MKRENKKIKKLVACLMCAVMIGATLLYVPEVLATTVETPTETQAFDEWDATKPVNGNFEAGYVGMEVYGWTKTAIHVNGSALTDEEATSYINEYRLTTAEDDREGKTTKVASLEKKGSGYTAATSQPIKVDGGASLKISFDYKTVTTSITEGAETGTDYYGVRLYVEEFDAEGASLGQTILLKSLTETSWQTKTAEHTTNASTDTIVVYLWMGGLQNRFATVYFDNVVVDVYDDLNGNFDNVTYLANGGRADGEMGPAGWTGASCSNGGVKFDSATTYQNNYKATVETIDGDNALCYSVDKTAGQVGGYSYILSPYIAIGANQSYSVQYDMMIDLVRGTPGTQKTRVRVVCYNANKVEISGDYRGNNCEIADSDWTTKYYSNTTPANTAYIRIGFYAGKDYANDTAYKLYFDNVAISVNDTALSDDWTSETCIESGALRDDDDNYTGNYGIRTTNEGADHEDALQLYVSRSGGILGGAVFYSKPISVMAGQSYTTSFDLKIENSLTKYYYDLDGTRYYTNDTTYTDANGEEQSTKTVNLFGATYVLRYKDSDGNVLSRDSKATGRLQEDMDWKSYTYDFTAPTGAATVEVGLVIGGYTMNTCPNLMYTWDNIILMESEAYEEYTTDNDLLFVMLEDGNANNADDLTVDVCDLVRMKKYIADTTETVTVLDTADMNNNRGTTGKKINDDDLLLLQWKLLGVTTTEQAQLVH